MSDARDPSGSVFDSSAFAATLAEDDELVAFDFTGPRWELVEHRPHRKRRNNGSDPYNTAERPQPQRPWQRIQRR
jgi:hypothetical protein